MGAAGAGGVGGGEDREGRGLVYGGQVTGLRVHLILNVYRAMVCIARPTVRLSIRSRSFVETAKHILKYFHRLLPHII